MRRNATIAQDAQQKTRGRIRGFFIYEPADHHPQDSADFAYMSLLTTTRKIRPILHI
jgi:hypothetical protein